MVDGPPVPLSGLDADRAGVSVLLRLGEGMATHASTLAAAVASLRPHDELLLLDSGASSETAQVADWADAQKQRRVLYVPPSGGFERSEQTLRKGLEASSHDLICVLRSGRLLNSECLDLLCSALEAAPKLAAVGPLAHDLPGRQEVALQGPILAQDSDKPSEEAMIAGLLAAAEPMLEVEGIAPDCFLSRRAELDKAIAADPDHFFSSAGYRLPQLVRSEGGRLGLVQQAWLGRDGSQADPNSIVARVASQRASNYLWEEIRRRVGSSPDPQLWDGSAFPPQDGLSSIVVLVWDNLDVTRDCLSSLYRETLRPFELILIDNGSKRETAAFLDQMVEHYDNVVLVRNEENQGYAYGCNQGLAAAQGEYVVLLNNDVVVTPHWLSDQIALFSGHPQIGLVGPRTNESAGPQLVPAAEVTYTDTTELPGFVEQWAGKQALRFTYTDPLTGLCMVLRRSLVRKIGGLDTNFWIGNLEDNDFCIRIARAGFQMALAHDVFVHHEGSSTFKAQKVDYQGLLARNWEFFCSKWGFERPLGTGFPTQELVSGTPFTAAFDYIPPEASEVYRRGLDPIAIEQSAGRMLLMIPELDGTEWKKPFADFVTTFGPEEDIGLLLRVDPPTPGRAELAVELVTSELANLGLGEEVAPEIILDTTQFNAGERGRLYASAVGLLCSGGSRAKLYAREAQACGLPLLDDLGAEGLRLRVDALQEASPFDSNPLNVYGDYGDLVVPTDWDAVTPHKEGGRPPVSILIVTYNSAASIDNCLTSLKMHCGPNDQIVVVDNVSGDATRTILRKRRDSDLPELNILFANNNLGFSRGVNLGLEQARCELVLMLNPDTVMTPGALDAMACHLLSDPQVGAVGPTSDYAAGAQNVGQYYSGGPIDADDLAAWLQTKSGAPIETKLLIGFCLMMRTETLNELGGMDAELFLGNDDLDISLRLAAEGKKLLIATDAFVHHKGQVSFNTEPKQRTSYLVAQSTNLLYEKLYRMLDGEVPDGQELWDVTWFQPQRGVVSVVVVVDTDLDSLAESLGSLLGSTHRELELVLVARSRSAADAARALIEEQPGVVHLQAAVGSPIGEALNLGLEKASGEYVLLTSGDVLFPKGTVAKLLALLETRSQWGLVGPRCPFSAGAQGLPVGSVEAMDELESFAWFWHESEAGASTQVAVLGDFCVLGRRDLLARLGGVDPSFEPGSFRGMDLSMRVGQAGYELGLAQDLVVHRLHPDRDVDEDDPDEMLRFATKWGLGEDRAESSPERVASSSRETGNSPARTAGSAGEGLKDPFNPGASPLEIRHQSKHLLLCIPDWTGSAWKEVLASFVGAFHPEDGVGLLVRIEPPSKEQVDFAVQALQVELAELGMTEERMPEIVIEASDLAEDLRPGLYTAASAYLSDGGRGDLVHRHEAAACGLTLLDQPTAETLRGLFR